MTDRLPRSAYKVFRTLPTRWMDNDPYGHMNNVVHYSLFDTTVNGWLIENGLLDIHHGEQIGMVAETGCRYFAEMGFPDVVISGLRAGKVGNSSVRYEVGLFRNDSEEPAAQGFFTHVYVNRATRRPTPMSQKLREALEALR